MNLLTTSSSGIQITVTTDNNLVVRLVDSYDISSKWKLKVIEPYTVFNMSNVY